jgi:tetratricopeptide (TPR) repeat protein
MKRRNRRTTARKSEKALIGDASIVGSTKKIDEPRKSTPAALYEAGLAHMQAGRYLDARLCCRQALAVDPNHADALHLMGLLALRAKQYDKAVEWNVRAIRQDPKSNYLASLGTALQQQGRREEALEAFDKAVQLKPDDAELRVKLGRALVELERLTDALSAFQNALRLSPRQWDAAYESGVIHHKLGQLERSLKHLDLCRELRADDASTLQLRGLVLMALKRFEESLADSLAAHAVDPSSVETRNNIGGALLSLGRDEEALTWFDGALEIRPNLTEALNNKIVSLGQLHRFEDAFALCRRMKASKLDNARTEWILAHLHLLTGNFEAGWAENEVRLRLPSSTYPKFPLRAWHGGESVEGKTILICADEGLGDTIQFVRYVPMLAERGARIVLVVQNPLYRLLLGLPGVSQCFSFAGGRLPEIDMHCPIGSLPLAFRTRLDAIPSAKSYLPSPSERHVQAWEDRLGRHTKLRVGLAWSGNPDHANDHNRSIPLRKLSRILDVDATFVSLQKDPRPDDAAVLRERSDIVDLTVYLSDFIETAALVSCLDLVITVDTSVAHLAGALGRPTWILLPYTPDYRWLLDRDDSPWYPSVRLFRQTESRDYESVLDRVRDELRARIALFKPARQHLSAAT